jgi:hypothetical protein
LTKKFAATHKKPCLHLDFLETGVEEAAKAARSWLMSIAYERLNIAGARASTDLLIYEKTKRFLAALLAAK